MAIEKSFSREWKSGIENQKLAPSMGGEETDPARPRQKKFNGTGKGASLRDHDLKREAWR